jgi:RecB family exonuclease
VARYVGDRGELRRLGTRWGAPDAARRASQAAAPALVAAALADELDELTRPGPSSRLLDCLLSFLDGHRAAAPADADTASRESRARAAVVGLIRDLRDAHARHDDPIEDLSTVTAMLRRWIEAMTFAAPTGTGGVLLIDVRAARYGTFDNVFLVGLVDGEWPERTRQSALYPGSLLTQLGWSPEIERLRAARAGFDDLLGLAAGRVSVSTVAFEDDAVVATSTMLEDLDDTRLEVTPEPLPTGRVTIDAGLAEVPATVPLSGESAEWLALRVARRHGSDDCYHGAAGARPPARYAVSAVEQYLNCPFKYFASTVLRLGEEGDDEVIMTPRSRGRFVHEVFRVFFERWQQSIGGAIDVETLEAARALARVVAEEHLGGLPARDRAVERVWLLGSAAGVGVVDRLLSLEAARPGRILERLLEFRFDGVYQLDGPEGPRAVRLRGVADRIDLLEDGRLRVIDYKSGRAPGRAQSLQLPIYGRCAEQELEGRHGASWRLDEAAYVAFGEPGGWVPLDRRQDMATALADGQERFIEAVDDIERGQFPPRPADPYRCVFCDYPTVCRKDYVGDD